MSDYDNGYLDAAGGARAAGLAAGLAESRASLAESSKAAAQNAALGMALAAGSLRQENVTLKNKLGVVKNRYQEVRVQNMDLASRVRGRGLMVDVLVDTLSRVDPGNERLDFPKRLEPSEPIPPTGGARAAGNDLLERHWAGLRAELDDDPLMRP